MTIAKILFVASVTIAAASASETATSLPLPLYCYGGEPFWSLTLRDAKSADFKSDLGQEKWAVDSIGNAMLRPTTWRVAFKGRDRRAFIFDEGRQSCSDSDGDRPLAYGLLLENGGAFLRGCCDPKQ